MKIKEIIVVEGKNDTNKLKQCIECETIETSGTHLSKAKLKMLKEVNEQVGIIVFTDPDTPGNLIRSRIIEAIPNAKHAFIKQSLAKTTKKIGVEHASKKDIIESLEHVITYQEQVEETITLNDMIELGLNGQPRSVMLREALGDLLFIGKCNVKTLWKRLNIMQINKEKVAMLIEEIYESNNSDTE